MDNQDIWNGYITDVDNNEIVCVLRRDFNCDKELIAPMGLLTKEQIDMAKIGLVMRFNLNTEKIEFMLENGEWL